MRAAAVLLLFLMGSAPSGAAEFKLLFDRSEVEWGKSLRGQIVFRGAIDPGSFDLSAWRDSFHVEHRYSQVAEDEDGKVIRRESVRLYPRATGEVKLPALSLAGMRSRALRIQVGEPRPGGQAVMLSHAVSAQRLSAGAPLTVGLHLLSPDPGARVSIDPLQLPAGKARRLAARSQPLPDGGGAAHELGWSLYLAEPGRHRLELPPLLYRYSGRDRYRFYLPLLTVQVDPLPAYVPLTVPVGRLAISSAIEDRQGASVWRVRVESDGLLPVGIPELEAALAALAGVEPERLSTQQGREARPDGVYSILELQAPLPRWLAGLGPLPSLSFQYFDPDSQRLQRLSHALPRAWRMPSWFTGLLWLMAAALSLPPLVSLWRGGRRWWVRRAQWLAITRAADAGEIRRLLLSGTSCRTLGEWAWSQGSADAPAAALNAACFGRSPGMELADIKRDLRRLLRRAR